MFPFALLPFSCLSFILKSVSHHPSTYSSSVEFIHLYTVFLHPPTLTPCPLTTLKAARNEASCSESCSHRIHSTALWLTIFIFCSTSLTASCVSKCLLFLLFPFSFLKNIALWSGLRLAASDVVLSFFYFVQFIPKMYPGYILLKKKENLSLG